MSCCIAFLFINPLQSLEFNFSIREFLCDLLLFFFTELIIPQIRIFQRLQFMTDVCQRSWMFAHLEEHLDTKQELPESVPFLHRQQVFLIGEVQAHTVEVVYERVAFICF